MLAINFHKTFVPERRLLSQLLKYAALGKEGTFSEISRETGIPMGKSSGKVPAIIDYARGMGLITMGKPSKKGLKRPILTKLGRVVYTEDPYLGEPLTQWVLHFNLCRPDIGAPQWNLSFAKGTDILGFEFTERQLESFMQDHLGAGRKRSGLVINTYIDDAALARAKVLTLSGNLITRRKAPINENFAYAYAAYILQIMETFFPERMQVSVDDFEETIAWTKVCGWNRQEFESVLKQIQATGAISVDRQLRTWILERNMTADWAWEKMYVGLM